MFGVPLQTICVSTNHGKQSDWNQKRKTKKKKRTNRQENKYIKKIWRQKASTQHKENCNKQTPLKQLNAISATKPPKEEQQHQPPLQHQTYNKYSLKVTMYSSAPLGLQEASARCLQLPRCKSGGGLWAAWAVLVAIAMTSRYSSPRVSICSSVVPRHAPWG